MDKNTQKEEKVETQYNPQTNTEEIKDQTNKEEPNQLEFCHSQRIAFKRGNPSDNNLEGNRYNNTQKNSMSSNAYKSKSRRFEENKEPTQFVPTNKKLRNTMTGLNNDKMKYESGLIDVILKVEKDNVNHYLKGDLAEMYHDINKDNYFFKNNVFLANVDHFEKRAGILDNKPIIPYYSNEDISYKLENYPRTNEIIEKFTEKSKTFSQYA